MTKEMLKALLPDGLADVHIYRSLVSTNTTAKEMAGACPHGTAVIAREQTGGRGRYGRDFYSPPGGLYMSVVLPQQGSGAAAVTAAAGVAVCRAIETVSGADARIKWVNDVLMGDKKVCGILCESAAGGSAAGSGWVVAGIGVNVYGAFPEALRPTAAALYERDPGDECRARLAAEILKGLLPAPLSGPPLLDAYRRRLSTLGRTVTVHAPGGAYEAVAEAIDEQCRLIVRLLGGERRVLHSGEVSVRTV